MVLGIRTDNTFEAKAELAAKGISEFKGPAHRPDSYMQLFLSDPDGFLIECYSVEN